MFCPSCGKAIAEGSAFCMHCGKAIPTVAAPQSPARQAAPSDAPVCPKCGQIDAVRKVSSILATDVTRGSTPVTEHGTMADRDFSVPTYRDTNSATALAQKLAPLSDNEIFERAIRHLSRPLPKGFPAGVKVNIKPFGTLGFELKSEQALRTYLYKIQREKLHYCGRCDVVFIPGEAGFVPLNDIETLLFTTPKFLQERELSHIVMTDVGGFWGYQIVFLIGAIGPNGYYTIKTKQLDKKVFMRPAQIKEAYEQIAQQLEKEGWERSYEMGKEWHELLFWRKIRRA